jgi:hypothetical protein
MELANTTGTPYLQVELTEGPYYRAVAEHVQRLQSNRATFIFQSEIGTPIFANNLDEVSDFGNFQT